MPNNDTLLAYLVPKLTNQIENAATEALGYILNKSSGSMQALNDLLQEGDFDIEPITKMETQVTYEDGSRPDMAGYDKSGVKRLLVEAKFWAALLGGQASGYARQFDHLDEGVLLFISPEVRIPTLWTEIRRQMAEGNGLESVDTFAGVYGANVVGTKRRVMLISWTRLLDRMASLADDKINSDIQQPRGLAQAEDAQAFLPLHSEELSPSLGRRVVWYNRLIDHVVDSRGVPEKWLDTQGLRATAQRHGYGRYIHLSGVKGDFWLGINHEMWARSGDTPLWLSIGSYGTTEIQEAIGRALNVQVEGRWVPIFPKLGVEYPGVLDDVVSQLKVIAELLRPISRLIDGLQEGQSE